MADFPINLDKSKLVLEGDETKRETWRKLINTRYKFLTSDQDERKNVYKIRRDFYVGNHGKYTNIVGRLSKEKKGHANAVMNYAGKTAVKIIYSLSNNPPHFTFPIDPTYKPLDPNYKIEEVRTQTTEDSIDEVLRRNKFWKRGYRRGVANQVIVGDFGIKVYPLKTDKGWEIKICSQEKMENLLVGWRGDDTKEFDFVIAIEDKTVQQIEEEWGIKVDLANVVDKSQETSTKGQSSHYQNNQWGTRNTGLGGRSILPSGNTNIPTVKTLEYDDENVYAILIEGKMVQFIEKDDVSYPKGKFWDLGENLPVPGSPWSMSDIDYMIDPNIELNEATNDVRDYIRVGSNQKYVAYNMSDFDPESIKTGSGGVIFVDSADGSAKFEPLQTNVNSFPVDTYLTRMKGHIHDLGVPAVTFGVSGSDSGRAKAIDYQSVVDLTTFKQDSWELVLTGVFEKIQKLLYFYFKSEFLTDPNTGEFKARYPEFDWVDVLPITASDKIVNIVNKVQMGLPFKLAFKELGYRDVDAVVNMMREEAEDPALMEFRSKMFQLTPGIRQATAEYQTEQMNAGGVVEDPAGNPNAAAEGPTLVPSQNGGRATSLPTAQRGGTTSYSSGKGLIDQARQNMNAKQ